MQSVYIISKLIIGISNLNDNRWHSEGSKKKLSKKNDATSIMKKKNKTREIKRKSLILELWIEVTNCKQVYQFKNLSILTENCKCNAEIQKWFG